MIRVGGWEIRMGTYWRRCPSPWGEGFLLGGLTHAARADRMHVQELVFIAWTAEQLPG